MPDKSYNFDEPVKNLSDAFRKDKNSNNYKLFNIEKLSFDKILKDINDLYGALDINQATGKSLDLFGETYNVPRGSLEDDQYRAIMLLRMAQYRTGSDHTSIINALVSALGIPAETFHMRDAEISGNVDVEVFPYDKLQAAGITVRQIWDILEDLMPVGVGLNALKVMHDVDETSLIIGTAMTHGLAHTLEVKPYCPHYELNVELTPAITIMPAIYHTLEVV